MSQFAVSAIRWNGDLSKVTDCMVHTLEEIGGMIRLTGGIGYSLAGLAEVAAGDDDEVWFVVSSGRGIVKRGRLRVQDGQLVVGPDCLLRELPTF